MGPRLVALATAVAAACGLAAGARAAEPRVTVVADSVMMAVQSNPEPMAILRNGIDARMEVGVCRTLTGQSCPFEGGRVPTLVDRVRQMGAGGELAPDVVVEMGYNDPADTFAAAVEESLQTLAAAGAQHVWWLTLRESQGQYAAMNDVLRRAAASHPELTLVDWNAYARPHPDWFQNDGEHLVYAGALGLAHLVHDSVLGLPIALPGTGTHTVQSSWRVAPLAAARLGRAYRAQLKVNGGAGPYRWRIVSGRMPPGMHLLANGVVYGRPRRAGITRFTLEVRDANGAFADAPSKLVAR